MFWKSKLISTPPIRDINKLPNYGFQFFFKNMGPFKKSFYVLSIVSIISTAIAFYTTYLISEVLSNIGAISPQKVFAYYFPLYFGAQFIKEFLDFYIRKYAEAFPKVYSDYIKIRFYKTLLQTKFSKLFNYSKEKLKVVIDKYCGGVEVFLDGWVWQSIRHLTKFIIICAILFIQNPLILILNLAYLTFFMAYSFRYSRIFAGYEKRYTQASLGSESTVLSFILNLNTIKKLGIEKFIINNYKTLTRNVWSRFKGVRDVHARRWLIQLNMFNFIYAGTFFFGVYQVVVGILPLGFLILIKWSYDNLWNVVVYFIEFFVSLVQQKQNAEIARKELGPLVGKLPDENRRIKTWNKITFKDVQLNFVNPKGEPVRIKIPEFAVAKGDKVGVIGESGSGKTALLLTIFELSNFRGQIKIDGKDARSYKLSHDRVALINSSDPLFNLSVYDNVVLGRRASEEKLTMLLNKLQVSKFIKNLTVRIGDKDTNFSAGQFQRLRLLRGLIGENEFYLMDEPFNGIDKENKILIMDFLRDYLKDATLILVTHNEDELGLVEKRYRFVGHELIRE